MDHHSLEFAEEGGAERARLPREENPQVNNCRDVPVCKEPPTASKLETSARCRKCEAVLSSAGQMRTLLSRSCLASVISTLQRDCALKNKPDKVEQGKKEGPYMESPASGQPTAGPGFVDFKSHLEDTIFFN